jgi:hypothetical protein
MRLLTVRSHENDTPYFKDTTRIRLLTFRSHKAGHPSLMKGDTRMRLLTVRNDKDASTYFRESQG